MSGKSANGYEASRVAGMAFGRYLKLVSATTRFRTNLETAHRDVETLRPAILTAWHGLHFLAPALIGSRHPTAALVSRSRDGEINAAVVEAMGLDVIRGSGGRKARKAIAKGGVRGLLEMIETLKQGTSIAITANVSRGPARRCGRGIIMLARHSGRPIVPAVVVTRREIRLRTWDRARIPLPFSAGACILGEPIRVPADADAAAAEAARLAVELELNRIERRADAIVRG